VAQIKHDTHRFIRQQYAWFRAMERRHALHWLDTGEAVYAAALDLIQKELER
jgi:hypothetical protein